MAKSYGFITTVTTNTLLYPKMAHKLKGLIDMLHFSLDSSEPQKHDESRGVRIFDKFEESIEVAKSLGERPDILFTVFSHNIEEIGEVYEKYCISNNFMLILNPVFEYNEVGANLSPENLEKLEKWSKRKLVYLNRGFIELRKNGGNKIENPICRAADTTIVISPENKLVLPCYHLGLESFDIDNQLYELRNSKAIKELASQQGTYKGCEGCTVNCYMQPSFATELSKYWLYALPSTLKYNLVKGTWKEMV